MTTNHKMEHISRDYILTLAHNKGYYNSESMDYGTDLMIRKAMIRRKISGGKRYLTSGKAIDVQLKAIHEKGITYLPNSIKYVFEVKNYNDLINRANETGAVIPMVLILFVLPDNELTWVSCTMGDLIIKKEAYWFRIPQTSIISSNKSNITIEIPKINKVNENLFPYLFSILFE